MTSASKTLLITTGGTIASGLAGGTGPASGACLLSAVHAGVDTAAVELLDLMALPSSQMTPAQMLAISREANSRLASGQYCGCVVTHGTDSMEETALFLDLLHDSELPLAVTGSMRDWREAGPEGANNLRAAAAVCAASASRSRGALVVLNEQIHAARYVTKTHSKDVSTFRSPDAGPVGAVYGGRPVFFGPPPPERPAPLHVKTIDGIRVDLIKAYAGADGTLVQAAVAAGARGLVLEGMGLGNLPAGMEKAAVSAATRGVAVALVTRCGAGPVLSRGPLEKAGVLAAGYGFNGQKARIALLLGLAAGLGHDELKALLG